MALCLGYMTYTDENGKKQKENEDEVMEDLDLITMVSYTLYLI